MGGWLVKEQGDPIAEFIPYSRGIPKSRDGRYHRCIDVTSIQGYGYKRGNALFHRAAAWRVIDGPSYAPKPRGSGPSPKLTSYSAMRSMLTDVITAERSLKLSMNRRQRSRDYPF
jgi:hypothetical protein